MKKLIAVALLSVALSAWSQGTSQEAVLEGTSSIATLVDGTHGWTFQPNGEISVTHLGAFSDYVLAGSGAPKTVGLWSADGTLLRSVTVSPGSEQRNQSYYSSVEPLLLVPLATYHIGVFYAGQISMMIYDPLSGSGTLSLSPLITLGGSAEFAGSFGFPAAVPQMDGTMWIGANAVFQGIPEPSVFALSAFAAGWFVLGRLTRRRSSN